MLSKLPSYGNFHANASLRNVALTKEILDLSCKAEKEEVLAIFFFLFKSYLTESSKFMGSNFFLSTQLPNSKKSKLIRFDLLLMETKIIIICCAYHD